MLPVTTVNAGEGEQSGNWFSNIVTSVKAFVGNVLGTGEESTNEESEEREYWEEDIIFTYKIREDNTVIITGYNQRGNVPNSIVIPSTIEDKIVTIIGEEAFSHCSARSIEIPNTVTRIEKSAFNGCGDSYGSFSVNIPEETTYIGDFAFSTFKLKSINISNKVKHIGHGAFAGTSITTVNIPSSVETIDGNPFYGAGLLKQIIVDSENQNYSNEGKVLYNKEKTELIHYCEDAKADGYGTEDQNQTRHDVMIPEGVNKIRKYAFYNCDTIYNVKTPSTLKDIEENAFAYSSLNNIELFNGLESIGDMVFAQCFYLTNINIPASVMTIGELVFSDCDNLAEITVAEGNSNYISENGILYSKDKTTIIRYPSAKAGTEYNIDENTLKISAGAFEGCAILENIILPKKLEIIEKYAFSNCGFTNILILENLRRIEEGVFYECKELIEIVLPNDLQYLGKSAFAFCENLVNVNIPEGISKIEDSTFVGCTKLENINIPESVVEIGKRAFAGCDSFTEITIPSKIIGEGAFSSCILLEDVMISDNTEIIEKEAFHTCWNLTNVEISNKSNLKEIGEFAFYSCQRLNNLYIPITVTKIGRYAFKNCYTITEVTIPESVTSIEEGLFEGCESIQKINIPNGVKNVRRRAFLDCTNLREVILPDSVESVEGGTFTNCTNITVTIKGDYLGKAIFDECTNLSVKLLDTTKEIPDSAFEDCTGLKNIEMGQRVTRIGSKAFKGCTGLTEIEIPNSVNEINSYAFEGCTGLKELEIPHTVTTIGQDFLKACSDLTIKIGINYDMDYIFRYCNNYKIIITDNVTSIERSKFDGCEGLAEIVIPDSVTEILIYAFMRL